MPTYSYACSACEHAFDARQSFSDAPLTTCPVCERETLRKVFSPVGVVFKGSGFYRTDSRAQARGSSSTTSSSASPSTTTPAKRTGDPEPTSAKASTSGSAGGAATPAAS